MGEKVEPDIVISGVGSMSGFCPDCGRMVSVVGYNWTHKIIEITHNHLQHIIVLEKWKPKKMNWKAQDIQSGPRNTKRGKG